MTKREIYLQALNNKKVEELVWAPNFDYWLSYNTKSGALQEKYKGLSRNDIVRSIDAYIWSRTSGVKSELDKTVKVDARELSNGDKILTYKTPVGEVYAKWVKTEDEFSSKFLKEHFIKKIGDVKIMRYIAEAAHYLPSYDQAQKSLDQVGDDGVSIITMSCVPALQFLKNDAGYQNGYYMLFDYENEVNEYIDVLFNKQLELAQWKVKSPGDVITTGDNMDASTLPPNLFIKYAVPYYQEIRKMAHDNNKLLQGHWCGRTSALLDLVPDCGLDIVEAVVTKPMDENMTIYQALDKLDGKVVMQGGIPAVMVCSDSCSMDDFKRYINEFIYPLKGRKGFILGMSDNVPPNADFKRVEMIAGLIK